MNIVAVSRRHKYLFVACSNRIKVFKLLEDGELDTTTDNLEDIVISEDKKINQIKVGMFKNNEVLVVVDMNSRMSYININKLPFSVNTFDNTVDGEQDSTVWSVDCFSGKNSYIATGSNARMITIWDEKCERRVIEAHDHNIPCVQFSPCGKYIASISIDKSIRLFDVKTGKKVAHFLNLSSWGWCVHWLKKSEIYGYQKELEKKEMDLEDYVLFAADEKYLYLLNPHKENAHKATPHDHNDHKPFTMELLSLFKFSQDIYYTYYLAVLHARFALCYYMSSLSTLVIIPQNTPWVHFIRVIYDQTEKRFTISSQHNIATNNNHRILGACLLEVPEELEKKATLYLVTEKKEVVRVEIKKYTCIKSLLEYTF